MGQFVLSEIFSRSQAWRWATKRGKPVETLLSKVIGCDDDWRSGALDDWRSSKHGAKRANVHTNLTTIPAVRSRLSPGYVLSLDFVTHADINDNVISDCGLLDFKIDEDSTGKNGEGICEYGDCSTLAIS